MAWLIFLAVHLLVQGSSWLGGLLGSMPPIGFVAVPAVLCVLALSVPGMRLFGMVGGALLIALGYGSADVNFLAAQQGGVCDKQRHEITVMNWNTHYWDQGSDPQSFITFLKSHEADIYTLQEFHYLWNDIYVDVADAAGLAAGFSGYHIARKGDLLTLSRFPISASNADNTKPYLRADVEWAGRIISIYNVHMPVYINLDLSPLSVDFYDFLRWRFDQRAHEFADLERELWTTDNRVIVAGDFNTTAPMGQMERLRARLFDTALLSAPVLPATMEVAGLRLWRFDYVLVDDGLCALAHNVQDPRGFSDHSVLLVRLGIAGEASASEIAPDL